MIRMVAGLAALAAAIRVFFWAWTQRVWEDALITILHAENAVAGLGLTHFKIDEPRIHGFTSPLSVLVPLVGELLHPGWGLGTMRIVSLAAAVATVVLAASIMRRAPGMNLPMGLVAMVLAYLAVEHHQVLWGMAGMETQLVCAILLFSAWCYLRRDFVLLGIAMALCVLVRPDFAIWTAIVGAFVLLECAERKTWRPIAHVVGIAAALYLPWIVFTTWYYGSPVPNTILAKSAGYLPWTPDPGFLPGIASGFRRLHEQVLALLGPTFAGHGTGFIPLVWKGHVADIMGAMIVVSLVTAIVERRREILLLHAFVFTFALYYVVLVPIIFGWYIVPFSAVAIILAAHGIATLLRLVRAPRPREALAWAACIAYVGLFAAFLPLTFRTERDIQARIEEPVRIALGRYLHGTPIETTIGGEPLGFIGYYSRRTYYDYPGLASRKVVEYVRRSGRRDLFYVLRELQPHYLALREHEARLLSTHPDLGAWLRANYVEDRRFAVAEEDRRNIFLAERNIDLAFVLMRRVTPRPEIVTVDRLGEAIATRPPVIEGAWSERGGFHGVPSAPDGARWWGSWNGQDANTGRIRLGLPALDAPREIVVPFLTGPATTGLAIRIVDASSGEVFASVQWLPVRDRAWGAWRVKLPQIAYGRHLALVAEDAGTEWGEWLAVAAPRYLRP